MADLDLNDPNNKPFAVLVVGTSASKTVILPNKDVTIAHLNVRDDGSTASVATDIVTVMKQRDTMAAGYAVGFKAIIKAGGAISFRAGDIPPGTDNVERQIELRATGNGATLMLLIGNMPRM